MAVATRKPREATAFMRNQWQSNSQAWQGLCQSSVRQAWGLPGGVPSAKASLEQCRANDAFHAYTGALPLREWEDKVPFGAPVWTDRPGGSTYGHIILAGGRFEATGRRIFWSVDITGYNEQVVPTPSFASDPAWSPLLG